MNHQPLKVYVAGASVERHERAIPVIKALREAGLVITHDWTEDIERQDPSCSEAELSENDRRQYADVEANGVRTADFLLMLAPNVQGSRGAWIEFGMAIAHRVPAVVSGAAGRHTIFTSLAHRVFESDAEGISYLANIHRGRS